MRLLWLSNVPWAGSGYGEQSGAFIPRIAALGHEMAVACNWGVQGARMEWNGITCYPSDNHWGNKTIGTYAKDHNADYVIALCDAWVLEPSAWPDDLQVAVWAPVDHYPLPPSVLAVLSHPQVTPIAMSRFGEQQMRDCKLKPLYVPHGIDTDVFYPRPEIKDSIRDELGVDRDAFLVGMVAANKGNPSIPRKGFPQALHAFAQFSRKHEDAFLYCHTDAKPSSGGGISLDKLAVITGCRPGSVLFPPEEQIHLGMPREYVAAVYQAFDVLLNPAMGEGFGIPIVEAQACGVPVIASNHSAMTELTQAGWLVNGDPWFDALQDSFFIMPSIGDIYSGLQASYEARDDQELRAAAAQFGARYDADLVMEEFWKPALRKLEGKPREVAPIGLNRAQRRAAKRQKVAA